MSEKLKMNSERYEFKKSEAITLISLVITIVVLIILASVAIYLSLGNNGIFTRAKEAKGATNKQTATEIINLKITNCQINKYAEKQEMPTLKELSLTLKDDNEIEYVTESSKLASTEYNVPSENPSSIYTKLTKYPYEFEINSSLQLASIDGIKLASEEKDNFIIPNYQSKIVITEYNSKDNQYIAVDNGYILCPTIGLSSGANIKIYIDNIEVAYIGNACDKWIRNNIFLPIAKGSSVYWERLGTVGYITGDSDFYFVPSK